MAWISVHEQVIGKKLRSLAKEIGCSQNEALGLLVRLWLWESTMQIRKGALSELIKMTLRKCSLPEFGAKSYLKCS